MRELQVPNKINKSNKFKMLTISQQPSFTGNPLEGFGYIEDEQVQLFYSTESSCDQYSSPAASSPNGISQQRQMRQFSDELVMNDRPHEPKKAKKTNHNASERDRRKKINDLYFALRSLLPAHAHHEQKKLSIPTTVSRVLKYIPELLKEAEGLTKKKESLLRKASASDSDLENSAPLKKAYNSRSSSSLVVSATQISDGEVMIQIATTRLKNSAQGEVVSRLEQDGLVLLNSSCVQSFQGRLFYNLHLQVCASQVLDLERLKKQLLSFLQNQEDLVVP